MSSGSGKTDGKDIIGVRGVIWYRGNPNQSSLFWMLIVYYHAGECSCLCKNAWWRIWEWRSRRLSANSQKVQKECDYILYMKYIKCVIYNIKGMIKQSVKLVNPNKECMEGFCTVFCISLIISRWKVKKVANTATVWGGGGREKKSYGTFSPVSSSHLHKIKATTLSSSPHSYPSSSSQVPLNPSPPKIKFPYQVYG